jgi:DNA-nicking Smr family endonuclease
MRKDKSPNKGLPPVEHVSEQQIRLTHAEIADQSGELPELDLHGETANQASVEIYDYILSQNAAGESCCRIVHGKGTGVLERVVQKEVEDLTVQGIIETSFQSRKYPGAAIVIVFCL